MSELPRHLLFTETHEWVEKKEDGTIRIGITDHAQNLLGDMVYVELPDIDANFDAGAECAVLESVKAAADVYCPVNGAVANVNEALADAPALVNSDPYGDGWLFEIKPDNSNDVDVLLNAEQYTDQIEKE